jgi:hypothetical protein
MKENKQILKIMTTWEIVKWSRDNKYDVSNIQFLSADFVRETINKIFEKHIDTWKKDEKEQDYPYYGMVAQGEEILLKELLRKLGLEK